MEIERLGVNCTACYACKNICPKDAISLTADNYGFAYPIINSDLCVKCGACDQVCPSINLRSAEKDNSDARIYAAWSLNEKIRKESTSGGVFSEIAMKILDDGGYVCGAIYESVYRIVHKVIDTVEELEKVRQSKYAQSDIGYTFREIKKLLVDGKRVLFSGTPCECAGLKNFLRKDYDNLLVCDFICRGSNSPKAYKSFVEALERKYNSQATKVWFKEKKFGWNRFSTYVEFENGKAYRKDRYTDYYMRGYLEHSLYLRPSCETCKFKNHSAFSDITMADFWGIENYTNRKDTNDGTSLIFLHTSKAVSMFEQLKERLYVEEHSYEEARAANPSLEKSVCRNPRADQFLEEIDSEDFCTVMSKYVDFSIKYRLIHKLKQLLWRLDIDTTEIKNILRKK